MPAIIGPVQINNVTGGNVHFGDTLYISPKSNSKTYSGQGSQNTGALIVTNNGISSTGVLDSNLVDQPTVGS
ncbi:spore germination protein [Bacillus sp. T33-2]|uniref:spore germination protein n=1 Tax=Bacillus sp. T33-2 TaxID=2054168 RepID=UPI000C766FDB|nr:spore germination protein [Bacillus sp. T33-2]PLR97673.1 hypothetical protein CVD19_09405 [Bacillus sp. T33-2]